MFAALLVAAGVASAAAAAADTCCVDWAKCGGKGFSDCTGCCNSRFLCNKTDDWYSECVPRPLTPFPPAPPSQICGADGRTLNKGMLKTPGVVSSAEIALIWNAATQGLTQGFAPGGSATCLAAVSISLGECGHPAQSAWMTAQDPVCDFAASGPGGIWQVTSQDKDDSLLAGCTDGTDPCCNARLAYAHAYNQGGATTIPADYCNQQNDCKQIPVGCGSTRPWNDPQVDLKKPGAKIPACSHTTNPWYPDGGRNLSSVTIDQEPCYWGPFSVAAGGVGREFFPGFYGWGGYLQHYLDSKAGRCDFSPQCASPCDAQEVANYPSYIQLAVQACGGAGAAATDDVAVVV